MNFKAYEQNSERKDERMFEVFYFILKKNPKKTFFCVWTSYYEVIIKVISLK